MNANDIHALVSDTAVEMKQEKFRKSVRGLLRRVLYKMDVPKYKVVALINRHVPNHMIPLGLSVEGYVENIVHRILKEGL